MCIISLSTAGEGVEPGAFIRENKIYSSETLKVLHDAVCQKNRLNVQKLKVCKYVKSRLYKMK